MEFKLISLSVTFFWLSTFAVAQNPKDVRSDFNQGNYFEAIKQYTKLLVNEPDNAEYNKNVGLSYLNTNIDQKLALDYLLKAEADSKNDTELLLDIARAYMIHLDYESAQTYLKKHREAGGIKRYNETYIRKLNADCSIAPDLLKYPVNASFTNLGGNINSEYPDYNPFVNSNGSRLLFTSRRKVRPGSHPEFDGYYPSDIMKSYYKDGKWLFADRLSDKINTIFDEQTVGLTSTGDTLFYYIDHVSDMGDIFTSVLKNGVYSKPKRLGDEVNSESIESACSISNDGATMLFSSNRLGGFGEFDLYMIRKISNKKWSEPINLGSEINTPLSEEYPTLSSDGKTLYFTSNGHPGMGGYDLYFSTWDEESEMWTKPQNMGYPVNSPSNEKNISFMNKGYAAVMSAFRPDGFGDLDIYQVNYEKPASKHPAVFVINVPMQNGETQPKLSVNNSFDEPIGVYQANGTTNRYMLALYPGKYFFYIDSPGYEPYTEVLVVNEFHTRQDNNVKFIRLLVNK